MTDLFYRNLGSSGLKISKLGLGTDQVIKNKEYKELIKCIKCAFNNGINYFDAADSYVDGNAEEILGGALKYFSRGDYIVSSKCFFPRSIIPSNSGLSRKHLYDSVHKSLSNFGLDYIDIYYFHRYDNSTSLYESMSAISDLIKSGKVLYWGVSRFGIEQIREIVTLLEIHPHLIPPICNQWYYNIVSREIENELVDYCVANGIGMIAYSPLKRGLFSEKSMKLIPDNDQFFSNLSLTNKQALDLLKKLSLISRPLDLSLSQLAMGWVLFNKKITSTLSGFRNESQLLESISIAKNNLDEDVYQNINELLCY